MSPYDPQSLSLQTDRPAAAPTLLIGIGPFGARVAARARDRLLDSRLDQCGGLLLQTLAPDDPPSVDSLRDAFIQLTRQQTVSRLESRLAIRRPSGRYLRLRAVCVAALAETGVSSLRECLQAIGRMKHPAAGLDVLFLLDTTHAADAGEVIPDLESVLVALQGDAEALESRARENWSAAPRLQFLLAHPHRADGSRLDHPRADNPTSLQAGLAAEPDEFEAALAAALAAQLAPGSLADNRGDSITGPPFALFGWAGETLPREMILARSARLLAADALERTAAPETGMDQAGEILDAGEGTGPWQSWVRSRDEFLLDRRRLAIRLLSPEALQGAVEVGDPETVHVRKSFYKRLRAWEWGESEPPTPSLLPLRVRMNLPSAGWTTPDPRRWPAEIQQLDARGPEELDRILQLLNDSGLAQQVAQEIAAALAQCVDLCVEHHLGGSQAARKLMESAVKHAGESIRTAESLRFAEPQPPPGLGLPPGTGLQEAWTLFKKRCDRLPGWPAVIARGLVCGALLITGCASLGLPMAIGWVGAAFSVGAAAAIFGWSLGRARQLGDYIRECLRARYGRRLFEYAQRAIGTPQKEGIYQALVRRLQEVEIPAVDQFEAARTAIIEQARENPSFPPPGGTEQYMLDADAAEELRGLVREESGPSALADDARDLLRAENLFRDWRHASMTPILDRAAGFSRRRRLEDWEKEFKAPGDFVRDLFHRRHSDPALAEADFLGWVRQRMDLMALRAVPLALQPPSYLERDNNPEQAPIAPVTLNARRPGTAYTGDGYTPDPAALHTAIQLAAPASFQWARSAAVNPAELPPTAPGGEDSVPPATSAADMAAWFNAAGAAAQVVHREEDAASCLLMIAGLQPADAVRALAGEKLEGAEQRTPELTGRSAPPPVLISEKARAANGARLMSERASQDRIATDRVGEPVGPSAGAGPFGESAASTEGQPSAEDVPLAGEKRSTRRRLTA